METELKHERAFEELILESRPPKPVATDQYLPDQLSLSNEYRKQALSFRDEHQKQVNNCTVVMYVIGAIIILSVIFFLIFVLTSKMNLWYGSVIKLGTPACFIVIMRIFYKIREKHLNVVISLEDKILNKLNTLEKI